MKINFWLNGAKKEAEISPDIMLLEFLRSLGCYSVKRGCETANCGLCTVLVMTNQCCPAVSLPPVLTAKRSPLWRDFRQKLKNLELFLPMKAQSSADSVIRDLS